MPSSDGDDFDDLSFSAEALAQIDQVAACPAFPPQGAPRARGMPRTLSLRGTNGGRQTHLNFRREAMYTKGKRWDRTAFAASGRRLDAEKAMKSGKGKGKAPRGRIEEDEEDEEMFDDEDEDPFGLEPPLSDMSEW
jgi:ATP-dependent DNA helicase MPH1